MRFCEKFVIIVKGWTQGLGPKSRNFTNCHLHPLPAPPFFQYPKFGNYPLGERPIVAMDSYYLDGVSRTFLLEKKIPKFMVNRLFIKKKNIVKNFQKLISLNLKQNI